MAWSKDEEFEVFNEKNVLIGRAKREEVHRKGLFHRSVLVYVLNSRKEIFLQKRAMTKDLCPGRWDAGVGEHLRPGERYEDGALRGLKEELGIEGVGVSPLIEPTLFDGVCEDVNDREFCSIYLARYDGMMRLEEEEVEAGRFFSREEIERLIERDERRFTPFFLKSWALVKNRI